MPLGSSGKSGKKEQKTFYRLLNEELALNLDFGFIYYMLLNMFYFDPYNMG